MKRWSLILFGTMIALAPQTHLWAQAPGDDCELLPGAREASQTISFGEKVMTISGPARFVCPGDVVLQADSAIGYTTRGEFELIGNVFYQDSVKTLTAATARYYRAEARLLAYDDVVLTDRKTLSRIEGPELEYLQATESRAEAMTIIQGRPHATFRRRQSAAGESGLAPAAVEIPAGSPADSTTPPLEVVADIMRVIGESRYIALGSVELTRGESRGFAREGEFDQDGSTMTLNGAARLIGESYELEGDRIEATLEDDHLREVVATTDAALMADDMELEAGTIHIFFIAGEVERLVAMGGGAGGVSDLGEAGRGALGGAATLGETKAARPVLTSRDLTLTADSIDALAPGQKMERLIAVGTAHAIRAPDSLDIGLPEIIARDWVTGDTIIGLFTIAEPVLQDSAELAEAESEAEPRSTLERLIAIGEDGGARSLYRIREKGREAEPPSANYVVANRITLVLQGGEVKGVEADGPIEGMHLQPGGNPGQREVGAGEAAGTKSPDSNPEMPR